MRRKVVKLKPSRIRYEQAHPTVSFRITRPTRERLKAAIAILGYSFGQWVEAHLDQDDRRAQAIAQKLGQERDGLGQQLQAVERRIQGSKKELAELDRKKEARRQEIMAPIELERARIINEAKKQAEAMVKEQQFWLSFGEEKVAEVKGKVREAEDHLREVNRQVEEGRAALKEIEKQGDALLAPLAKKATEIARQKGVPALACMDCFAYKMAAPMISLLAEMTKTVGKGKPSAKETQPEPLTSVPLRGDGVSDEKQAVKGDSLGPGTGTGTGPTSGGPAQGQGGQQPLAWSPPPGWTVKGG